MATIRKFIPFGELKADQQSFSNDGLMEALNVVPLHGNYMGAQRWATIGTDEPADEALGLHVHFAGGSTWYAYVGSVTALYESTSAGVFTDKTRLVGGAYATSTTSDGNGWQSTSFGNAIVTTNYVDDVQYLPSPATANFAKLAQSGGANPGMDPKCRFLFPVKNNLFLAYLNLAAAFDGLPIGVNPTAVCWSQTDNIRQYGSFNTTPQLIGAGYQPLNYDLGYITGGIGGQYGLVAMQRGWVRVDGPPFTFRPIVEGEGCRFPNSIVRLHDDVYYWGPQGPSVLRGGEGPPIALGYGKVSRTLIDNSSGFSPTYSIYGGIAIRHVSAAADSVNGLVYFCYTTTNHGATKIGDTSLVYNVAENRFSHVRNISFDEQTLTVNADGSSSVVSTTPWNQGIRFLQEKPDMGTAWAPARDLVGIIKYTDAIPSTHYRLAGVAYTTGNLIPTLRLGYRQLDPDLTTRIRRVRPVFSRSSDAVLLFPYVSVYSKNKPYDAAVTSLNNYGRDSHGWVVTTNTDLADFHRIDVSMVSNAANTILEFEGCEIEYETGGAYSA